MEDLYTVFPVGFSPSIIEETVRNNQVTIIQAETGTGKSTKIPQYLLSVAERVVVTQPRRLAAKAIAERVAEEMDVPLGGLVGYHTATDQQMSADTRLVFCTDGIEIMHQLFGSKRHEDTIVVIDEAHEWNLNLELLVAWFKQRLTTDKSLKLVLMSATIEAELLAIYFDNAVVLSTKGRMYPITEIDSTGGVARSVKMLLKQQCNVLVFMPGKAEIRSTIAAINKTEVEAVVLPLHAELSLEEQSACFLEYELPKCIVSTNVAQTSITVPDIDAVVDSGLERRSELVDGVEGLYLRAISIADREQRKGRAGRVQPGVYIDCCPEEMKKRNLFPKAPILNTGLEGMALQLACVGYKMEDFEFFHKPPQKHVDIAYTTLCKLGCISAEKTVTTFGRLVTSIPLSVRYSCMVASTHRKLGGSSIVDDYVLTAAILLDTGGVLNRRSDGWKRYAAPLPAENPMDVHLELAAYGVARDLPLDELDELGIDSLAYQRIRDTHHRVFAALRLRKIRFQKLRNTSLYKAMIAGLCDQLYKRSLVSDGYARVVSPGALRTLPEETLVDDAPYIVALPWNLQVNTEFGPQTKRLLRAATAVTPELVEQISNKKMDRSVS